ncbi:MAG: DUF1592 domain-containing protein [Deltaproteobacteria bacterium]|nr:DUF1592 domain-containing protein [Deltaproteobacteria bacterium]
MRWIGLAALVVCATALGCTGLVRDDGASDGGGAGMGGSSGQETQTGGRTHGSQISAAVVPLRRLSRDEYANTLEDLLGVKPTVDELFSTDTLGAAGLAEGGVITSDEIERMMNAFDGLVSRFEQSSFVKQLPCQPKNNDDKACAVAFIEAFATRAYRHPPSAQELAQLVAIFDEAHASLPLQAALLDVVRAALLSPRFHYRWERSDDVPVASNGLVKLGPFEVASRLSYFLWQSMPDAALFEAARANKLSTPSQLAAQVTRMLQDPVRTPRGLRGFFRAWLPLAPLETAPATDKDYVLKQSSLAATWAFLEDLVLGSSGDHSFTSLLASKTAFVDGALAQTLGLPGMKTDAPLAKVKLDAADRSGLFTQPAFLMSTTDTPLATIIHRGRYVYERLADCGAVPPPQGAVPSPPPRRPEASVREQLQEHARDGVCRGCHQFMDPMGFAFDGFDKLGRTRTTDDYGKPIDTHGTLPLANGEALSFSNAASLLVVLSKREESQRCFAQVLSQYAHRSGADDALAPANKAIGDAFVAAGGDILQLLTFATQQPSFIYRKPSQGEVLQ